MLFEKAYIEEIKYVINYMIEDENFYGKDFIDKVKTFNEETIEKLADLMLEDNELNQCISETIHYYIREEVKNEK